MRRRLSSFVCRADEKRALIVEQNLNREVHAFHTTDTTVLSRKAIWLQSGKARVLKPPFFGVTQKIMQAGTNFAKQPRAVFEFSLTPFFFSSSTPLEHRAGFFLMAEAAYLLEKPVRL